MKCLIVKEPFASLIVNGEKTWELRRRNTNIREKIAIGTKGKVIGYAYLADCWQIPIETLRRYNHLHYANDFLDSYAKGKSFLYAWELHSATKEPSPYPYSFSTGSWCKASVDADLSVIAKP